MAPRSLILAALLVLCSAQAAVGGNFFHTPPGVLVTGVVRCNFGNPSDDYNVPVPKASAQLVCSGNPVAGATADDYGAFIIYLQPYIVSSLTNSSYEELLAEIVSDKCKVVAATPLPICIRQFPPRAITSLTAPLQLLTAINITDINIHRVGSESSDQYVNIVSGVVNALAM